MIDGPTPACAGDAQLGLRRRMAHGAVWLVALRFSVRGMGMVSTLLTAPLLSPADFGLVALATTFATLLEITTDFSLDLALIRDQQAGRAEYDTAWTLNLFKGVLVAAALVAAARPVAAFFGDPRLEAVVYWLAVVSLAGGAVNIGIVDFRKELELGREFTIQFWAKLGSVLIAVGLAYAWRSYWALVISIVLRRLILLAMSFIMSTYRPRLSLSRWRKLIHFSKWLLVNNFLMFIRERVDTLIVGKLAGAGPLGLYTMGLELADLTTTELAAPVSRAVFPGYARLAGDRERLAASYLETFSAMLLVSMPASVGIGLAAEPLIRVWLGPAWLDTVPLIQAMIVFGLCRTAYGNAGAVYMALGRPRIEPAMMLAYILVLVPLLYLLIPSHGVMGAAYALTTTAAANLVLNKLALIRLLGLPPWALLACTWRTIAATTAMAAIVRLLPPPLASDLGRLVWTASLGGSAFLGALALLCCLAGWPPGPELRLFDYMATALRRRPALVGQGGR